MERGEDERREEEKGRREARRPQYHWSTYFFLSQIFTFSVTSTLQESYVSWIPDQKSATLRTKTQSLYKEPTGYLL